MEPIRSVTTALRVLEAVAEQQPVGVSELSRQLGIPKSSVQRILFTLSDVGWVVPGPGTARQWSLGSATALLADRSLAFSVRRLVRTQLLRLRDETGESTYVAVLEGDEAVFVDAIQSPHSVRTAIEPGVRVPLHATGSGKALLAGLPPDELDHVLAGSLKRYTSVTLTDPAELRAELEEIRARGYSCSVGELEPDISSVSAPVLRRGRLVAALTIMVPTFRMTEETSASLGPLVRDAARELERQTVSA